MESKYVVQRTDNSNGDISYLSPGKVNFITPANHQKYGTRYGKWFWSEAEELSRKLNADQHSESPYYSFVPLPERNHK